MNAALQCAIHSPVLSHYVLKGGWKTDLNTESVFTKGELAFEYSKLVAELWLGSGTCIPRTFKRKVGTTDERWQGFEQHDTEEFISYLLNCLHDDLNRIKGKPAVQKVDEKLPEAEYALAVWQEEKNRHDSIVDDLFKGLFRSKLLCPDCLSNPTKFDPFYSVSLQLPMAQKGFKTLAVTYVPPPGQTPIPYRLVLPASCIIGDVKQEIAKAIGIENTECLLVAELRGDRIRRIFFNDEDPIALVDSHFNSIFAYHITRDTSLPSLSQVTIPVLQSCALPYSKKVASGSAGGEIVEQRLTTVSHPFFVTVPRRLTYAKLHAILEERMKDFIHVDVRSVVTTREMSDPDEAMRTFEVSLDSIENLVTPPSEDEDKQGEAWRKRGKLLMEFGGEHMITLSPETVLSLDWCAHGVKYKRFKKVPVPTAASLSPHGGDDSKPLSLIDCMKDFVREEILSKNDTWYCPKCKDHKQAKKAMDIWKAPPILRIDLKRFQNRGMWLSQKLDKFVEYPLTDFDITPFVSGPVETRNKEGEEEVVPWVYDLYAVACHMGWTANSGHYTALCKNSADSNWYHYDDSRVTKVSEGQVVNKNAYLLFYKRKDLVDPLFEKEEESESGKGRDDDL